MEAVSKKVNTRLGPKPSHTPSFFYKSEQIYNVKWLKYVNFYMSGCKITRCILLCFIGKWVE